MSDTRPFLSLNIRLHGVIDVLVFLALTGTWLGLLGSWHWLLDLFSHFRCQYLVVTLMALVWSLWRKLRLLSLAAASSLLLNTVLISSTGWTQPKIESLPDFHLRVVSFNVLTSNHRHAEVLDYLRQSEADLLFIMEVDDRWAAALKPLTRTHPHHLLHPRQDNFGLALFSRVPLDEVRILTSADIGSPIITMPCIQAHLTHAGHAMTFLGIHPLPPMGKAQASSRDAQMQALARWVSNIPNPVMIAGDLNATPWSHGMDLLTAGSGLNLAPDAWKPTWRAASALAIPIDHALARSPLMIRQRQIGPDLGSDHRPQLIELGWAVP